VLGESGGSIAAIEPPPGHLKKCQNARSAHRQAATSTFNVTTIRRNDRMGSTSGSRRAADPRGCGVGRHRTVLPPFMAASAHHWRSRTAADGPTCPPRPWSSVLQAQPVGSAPAEGHGLRVVPPTVSGGLPDSIDGSRRDGGPMLGLCLVRGDANYGAVPVSETTAHPFPCARQMASRNPRHLHLTGSYLRSRSLLRPVRFGLSVPLKPSHDVSRDVAKVCKGSGVIVPHSPTPCACRDHQQMTTTRVPHGASSFTKSAQFNVGS
jgi:hypothetical protein